jgi:hypothetical protein
MEGLALSVAAVFVINIRKSGRVSYLHLLLQKGK